MTAQQIHKARIQEHLQVIKDALTVGLELWPATIDFHTSACAIDIVELYLHKTKEDSIALAAGNW